MRGQRFGGHRVLRQLSRVRLGIDAARMTTVNGSDGGGGKAHRGWPGLLLPYPPSARSRPASVRQTLSPTIEHPAAIYGDCDGLFRHVIQLGRQHPQARFAIRRVMQCPHQETGGPFGLLGHESTTRLR